MVVGLGALTEIGVILGFALVLSIFFKRIGQNPVLGFILSGFLLGPFLLGYIHPGNELLSAFAEMGLFVLLFYLGIELSFRDFMKAGVPTLGLALVDMLFSVIGGVIIAIVSGFSLLFSVVVGMMLFSTSSAIVGKFLLDRGLMKDKTAQLAMAILILQDFLGILLLVFISSLSNSGSALQLGLTAVVFAAVAFYGVHRLSGVVERLFEQFNLSAIELTLYGLGIGLLVATLGSFLGLSSALGAYFAGFALSELKAGTRVKEQLEFLREFFLLFFFVAFGATLFFDPVLGIAILPPFADLLFVFGFTLILSCAAILAHAISLTMAGPLFGLTNRASSEVAVLLTPLGEFVIIIALAAIPLLGKTEAALLSPIAFLLILITLFVFQPLYRKLDLHDRLTRHIPAFAPRPLTEQAVRQYNDDGRHQIHELGFNLLVIVFFGWITMQLYSAVPDLGIPVPNG
ncbi:MAG: cation:proton antiporter, partial [Candidatus Diapherotrites archaeon]|nr:cation:proton antiporter [Candidatus Diapherotrites archaeon]